LAVFDDHNAEVVLQQRAFETDARQPRRWVGALYSLIQWKKLRRYEARVCRAFDRVVAVSPADAQALQRLVPGLEVSVVLNGVDTELYRAQPLEPAPEALVFTGKMDFRPNVDAVLWFCQEILPRIWRERASVHFTIVGRDPHPRVQALARDPRIRVTGYVEDVRPYIAGAAVYVVPLRMGGGTRLKVLEAMAMGQAIVSTTLGCEGIALTPGREAVLADTAQEFARRVVELLGDEERRRSLGRWARRLVEAHYDWRVIVPRLEQVYE
jgi:glycosyltransferase involved in cell wall biosynthesis